jgi:O-methyltransferase
MEKYVYNLYDLSFKLRDVPGHFIEFGVWKGFSLEVLAVRAKQQHKTMVCVDSFEGMPEPSLHDYHDGKTRYPKGRWKNEYSKGGTKDKLNGIGCKYRIYKGFVPDILSDIQEDIFSLAHLDMDIYYPMYDTLNWLHGKVSKGGLIICHDYFPDRDWLASGGIQQYLKEKNIKNIKYNKETMQVWWKV